MNVMRVVMRAGAEANADTSAAGGGPVTKEGQK
jgi:hypothetical protein